VVDELSYYHKLFESPCVIIYLSVIRSTVGNPNRKTEVRNNNKILQLKK